MIVVVLAGGLGSGKSVAAEYFRSRGAVTLDLDDIAAHSLTPGSPTLERIAEEFGTTVLAPDGSLDRAELARIAFSSADGAKRLDGIVHPAVIREVGPAIADLRLLPEPPSVVVIEVPLLAEAPVYAELADVVLVIVAPEHVRVARAVERGMDEADARRRIAVQASDAERAELADVVVVNDASHERFVNELARFWDERLGDEAGAPSGVTVE